MDEKTILEELLERSPNEAFHKHRMDKAYHLMAQGMSREADALFDEILAEEPFNRDALTGKNLLERQKAVELRLDNVSSRARRALPQPDAAPEVTESTAEKPPRRGILSLLRSRKVLIALDLAFAVLCASAAVIVSI